VYENFTDQALRVMEMANEEANRWRHEYVGTEHMLLGLVQEEDSLAVLILTDLGLEPGEIRDAAEGVIRRGLFPDARGKPLTPRAKKVIDYALEESARLRNQHVGTEHLLLALLRDPETVACQVLQDFELSHEEVARELDRRRATPDFGQSWWE
jgi:ATP-dependent Clp protease ATP-binding subunit ClpC